jgi:hypothetical protein
MEVDGMVNVKRDRKRDTGGTIISILKYDQYQTPERDTDHDTNETQTRHKRDYQKEGKEGNETITIPPLNLPESLKPCEESIRLWLRYKAERRQAYKPLGLTAFLKDLERLGGAEQVKAAIDFSMAQNYAGVFPAKEGSRERKDNAARIAAPAGKYARVGVRTTAP